MKKIGCSILCLMLSLVVLCACTSTYETTYFKHNYQRDYSQVIVTIDPIPLDRTAKDDANGYKSDPVYIYKSQLVRYVNDYASTYINSYNWDYNEVVDYFLEQLIMSELVIIEADFGFERHDLFWTKDDIRTVQEAVYGYLDDSLDEIYDNILKQRGEDVDKVDDDEAESTETTYPVKPEEEHEEERVFETYGEGKLHDDWYLSGEWYTEREENFNSLPGEYGDEDMKSLAAEGVKRLVSDLADSADTLLNATDKDKEQFAKEAEELRKDIEGKGAAYAYRRLGKTLMVKKLVGDNYIRSQKMTILQKYIEDKVVITDEEIVNKYNKMLEDQISNYADEDAFDTAANGTDLVLYRPSDNYIYVKHILIPFSTEQTDYLTEYKKHSTKAAYEAERAKLVNNIVAYKHIDGEDDKDHPLTVSQIWSKVRAVMSRASADPYEAERAFNDLIYDYNTDPGSFDNEYGYAVQYKLGDGDTEKYMVEFAAAARAFRDEKNKAGQNYKVGQLYDKYVVTDYGVHIMYYAADYYKNFKLGLNDYATPGRYTSVKEKIKDDLYQKAIESEFTVWQESTVKDYRNNTDYVKLNDSALDDMYQK